MKSIKKQIFDKKSRKTMMEGINQLADVVGSTMGARGRNVVLDKEYGAPLVINDGVTIAREIFFDNQLKNIAAQLIKDSAIRTNDLAGDGTTGSIVLSRAIVKSGWEMTDKNTNPVTLRREIEKAAEIVESELKKQAEKVQTKEQAIQIATVSVQDSELGEKIGSLMFDVGVNGAVTIKNSLKRGVFIEKDGGMRLEGQLTGGIVENPDKWETKLENLKILILKDSPEDHEFETKWVPLMRQFADGHVNSQGQMEITKVNVPTLLVIAEKLSRRFIMAMNQNKEIIKWVWFRPTTAEKNMKEIYKDLQSMVGGEIVFEEDGVFLSRLKVSQLGSAETAIATRHELILTVSDEQMQTDAYLDRCNEVKGQVSNAEDEIEQGQIKDRYANLTGGVAAIKVEAATAMDTTELKLRIEDAINATRSAMEEGYVAGGGVALYNASKALEGKTAGEKVLKEACKAALTQILYNAGYEEIDKVIESLKDGEGINVLTDKVIDMKKAGIVDPLKVIRLSLIHAVSVAGLLLTSEYVVTNEEDKLETMREFFKGR